jgi:hypothetical protein
VGISWVKVGIVDISTKWRQLSYLVIFMSELVTHYAHLKDRITLGSFSISTD